MWTCFGASLLVSRSALYSSCVKGKPRVLASKVKSWHHSGHTHTLSKEDTIRLPVSNNRARRKQLHLSSHSSQSCSTQGSAFILTMLSQDAGHFFATSLDHVTFVEFSYYFEATFSE